MAWTDTYIRIPWQELGRDREGCDCWGLVRLALREEFGVEVDAYEGIAAEPGLPLESAVRLEREQEHWTAIGPGSEQPGDVALFPVNGDKGVLWHVGIIARAGMMLHIERGRAACVESIYAIRWKNRLLRGGIYRHEALKRRPAEPASHIEESSQ